jgi:hypothetical protein
LRSPYIIASTIALIREIIISSVAVPNSFNTKEKYICMSIAIIAMAMKNIGRGHITIQTPSNTNSPCQIIKLISGDRYVEAQEKMVSVPIERCLCIDNALTTFKRLGT